MSVNDIDGFWDAFLSTVSFFEFFDDLSEALDSVGCAFLDFYEFGFEKVVVFLKEILNLLSFLGVDNQGNCKVVQTLLENGFEVWINLDLEIKEFQSLCILWKGVGLAIKVDFGAFDKLHFSDFFLWNNFWNNFQKVVRHKISPWVVVLILVELTVADDSCGWVFDQIDHLSVVQVICNDEIGSFGFEGFFELGKSVVNLIGNFFAFETLFDNHCLSWVVLIFS